MLLAKEIRQTILTMAKAGNSVHIACAFSIVEILIVLYNSYLKINPETVHSPERNLFCLSKGHGVMALYACLIKLKILPEESIKSYFSDGSKLKGLSDSHITGVEVSGGSLGHGITVAVGMALSIQFKKQDRKVYCLIGDGEMNEGSVWESLMFAAHWKLENFFLIIDANDFQAMGRPSEILNCESLLMKLKAFNFEVLEVEGHDETLLFEAFNTLNKSEIKKPKAIIARTVKGYGVSFMQDDNAWHYSRLNEESFQRALRELR